MNILAALLSVHALAAAPVSLIYTKSFPGSSPAFCRVLVTQDGGLEYSESPDDNQPVRAQIGQGVVDPLLAMAKELDYFKSPLESGLKVAKTGEKTLEYHDPNGAATKTTFNYSTNVTAQRLVDKMEQIASSERAYLDLDRTVHFDKLGVNDSLATIESLWLRKQLAAPAQFIPLLNRVATHESFMHLARERAARLKDEFSKPMPVDTSAGASGRK